MMILPNMAAWRARSDCLCLCFPHKFLLPAPLHRPAVPPLNQHSQQARPDITNNISSEQGGVATSLLSNLSPHLEITELLLFTQSCC